MKEYKKVNVEDKAEEKFETKKNLKEMNLERGRMKFAIETQMVKNFKFNYMNDRKNEESNWACEYCEKIEKKYNPDSMAHALYSCSEYSSLRCELNLNLEVDSIDFFIQVVNKRNELANAAKINK